MIQLWSAKSFFSGSPLAAHETNYEPPVLLAALPPSVRQQRLAFCLIAAFAVLKDIASSAARGTQVIASLRAMFKKSAHARVSFDANDLVREVLTLLDIELRAQRVLVSGGGTPWQLRSSLFRSQAACKLHEGDCVPRNA
jgi:hypothetical protein